jgi:hypothetical protein
MNSKSSLFALKNREKGITEWKIIRAGVNSCGTKKKEKNFQREHGTSELRFLFHDHAVRK